MDTTDRAVRKLRQRPVGAYKAPKVKYICMRCTSDLSRFKTEDLVEAWLHSLVHGPWPELGSAAFGYVYGLSQNAHTNGLAHPRGSS